MHHDDFHHLVSDGKISMGRVTEKTDGSAMEIGHDEHGLYTRYSGSGKEKMRSKGDYVARAMRRSRETGNPPNLGAAKAFGEVHERLANNPNFTSYMRQKAAEQGGQTVLRGELFHRPSGVPSDKHPGHVKFVATSYHPRHLGRTGAFVVHTGLEDNQGHDINHITKHLGDEHMSFHHDVLEIPHTQVDVSKERDKMSKVDRALLSQRKTKKNAAAKEAETRKLDVIRRAVSRKVDSHIKKLGVSKSKWGEDTPEGHVVHPPNDRPHQPRFKVTSDAFRQFKADADAQAALKKRIGK
jgi:hypothetical protein